RPAGRCSPMPCRPCRWSPATPRARTTSTCARGCNRFLVGEPRRGWRHVTVSERRTRAACAHVLRALVEVHAAPAERIGWVLDPLNTHTPASWSEPVLPAEARRLTNRVALHSPPKHGRWL